MLLVNRKSHQKSLRLQTSAQKELTPTTEVKKCFKGNPTIEKISQLTHKFPLTKKVQSANFTVQILIQLTKGATCFIVATL